MQGGLVGAHAHGRQLRVGQVRLVHGVELVRGHRHVLGEAAVGAVAVVVRRQVDVAAVVRIKIEIQQAALAEACRIHAFTDRGNPPGHVGALNTGEGERGRTTHLKGRHLVLVLGGIQAFTGLTVGVVLGGGGDAHQHLARRGSRHRHIVAVNQLIHATVAGEHHGRHGARDSLRMMIVVHGLSPCVVYLSPLRGDGKWDLKGPTNNRLRFTPYGVCAHLTNALGSIQPDWTSEGQP